MMVVKFKDEAAKWWLAGEKCFSNVMALLPPRYVAVKAT
jgi:hypothetical protein